MSQNSELETLATKFKNLEGLLAVILYGSHARGEAEEGSDVDLLLLFRERGQADRAITTVSKKTAASDLFVQAVCLGLEEFKESSLLTTVLREGKALHTKIDLRTILVSKLRPYCLVEYRISRLKPKEKVLFVQELEGRGKGRYRYPGIVQKLRGVKIGRSVVMIPQEQAKTLIDRMEESDVTYSLRYIWA